MVKVKKSMVKPIYKIVKVRDGKYLSCLAGKSPSRNEITENMELEYKVGQVTEALLDSLGIFCYYDKAIAILDAKKHMNMWQGNQGILYKDDRSAVLECLPIGMLLNTDKYWPQYPAIYVKEVLWEESKPSEISHTFKIGDKIKVKDSIVKPTYGFAAGWESSEDIGIIVEIKGGELKVKFPNAPQLYYCYAPEMELAYKDKWQDVTDACTFINLRNYQRDREGGIRLSIMHNQHLIGSLGLNEAYLFEAGYRIEPVEKCVGVTTFRILKKIEG